MFEDATLEIATDAMKPLTIVLTWPRRLVMATSKFPADLSLAPNNLGAELTGETSYASAVAPAQRLSGVVESGILTKRSR